MERTGKSFDFFFAKCKFCQIPFLSKILKMMENNWWITSFEGFDKAVSNRTYGVLPVALSLRPVRDKGRVIEISK
jgi:hypothetical protein